MTKSMAFILIGLLATYGVPSSAQTFRCTTGGKTVFSDQPCSNDAKQIAGGGSGNSAPTNLAGGPKEVGAQNCKAGVAKSVAWKDPESIRIGDIVGGEMELLDYADQKIGARRYTLNVNAMNEMGAYVGEKRMVCFTSQDGMRLLKMDTSMIARSTKD
jgi:hypothetical protein